MIPHLFFSQLVLLGLLLYALLSALKDGKVSKDEAIERLSRSSHWEWGAMDCHFQNSVALSELSGVLREWH